MEGHADIARAFIFHCNIRSICFISLKKAQPNTLDDFLRHDHQQRLTVIYSEKKNGVEKNILSWAEVMECTIGKSHVSGITSDLENSNSEREEHISKQTRLISTILSKESEEGFFLKLTKSDDKNQASSNIQMDIVNDPSIRCILSFGMRKNAACRECLALHTEWLSIRTYHLSFRPKIPLAELSVFSSKYKSENIVKKCRFGLAFLP